MRNWHPLPLFKHTNHKIDDRGIFAAGTMALLWLAPCSISTPVAGAEVADINWDGSPEIYVYVTSASSGSYGSLVAYLANRRKSLSEIHLPPVTQEKTLSKGYRGHNDFAVVEGVLVQRFPVYRDTDTNANPTGARGSFNTSSFPARPDGSSRSTRWSSTDGVHERRDRDHL